MFSSLGLVVQWQWAIKVPLPMARRRGSSSGASHAGGATGEYLLTFLDDDMLIGRAQQGIFIFHRHSGNV